MPTRRPEITDPDRKAIRTALEALVSKYGLKAVRAVCNGYLKGIRIRAKLQAEIAAREKELTALKARIGG